MNQAISRALWLGTAAGVLLCAAATLARVLGLGAGATLARLGVLALFLTPPLRLVVTAGALWREGSRRHAAAALTVLAALAIAALRAFVSS